ncbi:MAG: pyrimidine-nucleoside phosphorylase [Oscillospiraceae bacterium]|nr:pyrimidine-nucleoside phosphorylase [Oscillospiraceae bacterium]
MLMTDIICKKRDGEALTKEEIGFFVKGYVSGEIPDYQASALCMAIYFRGMNDDEILDLTLAMMNSGETVDLSGIEGIKADKHSTGGVGDKTSLVLCPMAAAAGLKIAKMSGRGLGHTGGTIDKLESFPGFTVEISEERFLENVNRIGISIIGQSKNLVPADKKLYALRDVTGTVPSVPLIVSSIMSKKLASGGDIIVLDVKCGSGSFMKTKEEAEALAKQLVRVGKAAGKKTAAVITDMDEPLGNAVGNALEVKEAIAVLKGEKKGDLYELCMTLGSLMLVSAEKAASLEDARKMLEKTISDGSALEKLALMVEAQGGDSRYVYDESMLPAAKYTLEVLAPMSGYVKHIEADDIGLASMHLGGGRATKEDTIDLSVGIIINRKVGDYAAKGESIATIHADDMNRARAAAEAVLRAYEFSEEKTEREPLIKEIIQ